jgi:pyruvate dehydrogenase E2 component (dihydrolipoamide acetyltransferase)
MATEIVMPRLSDTMDSGTIARWLKHEGEAIKKGDIIAEIETDKADMELESFADGVLAQILVSEGQSAELGAPIAVVAKDEAEASQIKGAREPTPTASPEGTTATGEGESPDGAAAQTDADAGAERASASRSYESASAPIGSAGSPKLAPPATIAAEQPVAQATALAPAEGSRVKASPLARRIAQEHGIDLGSISGTGPGGRIVKEDVQDFLRRGAPAAQPAAPAAAPAPMSAPAAPQLSAAGRAAQSVEMTRMQQTIARRMTESHFSAPEFVLVSEVDMTEARALLRSISAAEGAPKVGPNDLIIKAVANALAQHPEANAGWENGTIVRYGRVNVGFAVALPEGLVVPVIQDTDKKTLGQIAIEAKALIAKAQGGKLAPIDYEHGTFSVSNLGMYGIDQFTPVINMPEACILGVGAITPKPVVVDGQVIVRDRMRLTLSCDHRVLYGAQGAEFLRTLSRLLENPVLIVL